MSMMKTEVSGPGRRPSYVLADDRVATGASLGNAAVWVNVKSTGAIERVFSTELGVSVVGSVLIQYAGAGGPIVRHADNSQPTAAESGFVPLRQEEPGEFEIEPACQRHRFTLAGSLHVTETIFVPLRSLDDERGDPPLVYQLVEVRNVARFATPLRVTAFARLRGETPADVGAVYDQSIDALVAVNASDPSRVRVFGCSAPAFRYACSCDFGSAYDPSFAKTLTGDLSDTGDILGCLQVDLKLDPGEMAKFAFITGVYASRDLARNGYRHYEKPTHALRASEDYLREALRVAEVLTPDPQLNLGALWSKVNMRRVMARYASGLAFTNEPGISSNVVARDSAWFAYGCDHFMPSFSRALIDTFTRLQYDNGKIPEYYSAVTQRCEDYGLNINDDTPLFIMAVNHHYRSTGDDEWLRRVLPSVERAARYIVSQMDDRDLVVCTAKDPRGNVWATAGWRNIIPNYSISGAVTEVNALCAAALRSAANLVADLGGHPKAVKGLRDVYDRVVRAMETHLRNPENGLYYLNIGLDGVKHSDVTGDELFPVMCRVCDDETGYRIISRLNSPDFWTAAGLRTVSRDDPLYEPTLFNGLLGGVWPGLTWWYAFAAARYHPEFMVRALRSSFEHYAIDPGLHNTVPGEFGEWFDGETLVNRGMRLSPWEPPRFLWAAIEGVCGFSVRPGKPTIRPLIPPIWRWVGVRRVPYHGKELSYFAVRQQDRMHVYASTDIDSSYEPHVYTEDVTDRVVVMSESAAPIALAREGEMLIMIGNVGTQTTTAPLDISGLIDTGAEYDLRMYNSERDAWIESASFAGTDLSSFAVPIEMYGFRLISLKQR
jgi:hypothetical protein